MKKVYKAKIKIVPSISWEILQWVLEPKLTLEKG